MKKRTSSTLKNRNKAKKQQKKLGKQAFRLETKRLRFERFKEKQKTKRLNVVPEAIKAAGQSIALASSPTAGSVASADIVKTTHNNQMSQLINPTSVAGTNNAEEEEKELNFGYQIR